MKNAHLRMGHLEFQRMIKDTMTHIRLPMDRMIAEYRENGEVIGHLISVFGNDQEIAAIAAALTDSSRFQVSGPGLASLTISLGEKPVVFRGSLSLADRKRPVRHLIALSEELASTRAGGDSKARRTILCDKDSAFVLYRLSVRFGLPAMPEWSDWFVAELQRIRAVEPLVGFGCSPVVVKGTKKRLLALLSLGLRRKRIYIPEAEVRVRWQLPGRLQAPQDIEGEAA